MVLGVLLIVLKPLVCLACGNGLSAKQTGNTHPTQIVWQPYLTLRERWSRKGLVWPLSVKHMDWDTITEGHVIT